MKKVGTFIFGFAFATVLSPILDGVCEVALQYIETLKLKPNRKIMEANKELADMQEENEEKDTVVEGFTSQQPIEVYEDDGYDYDKWDD